jgi:hypothetical protein
MYLLSKEHIVENYPIHDIELQKVVERAAVVYSLDVSFRNVADHSTWAFVGIYGPNSDRDRRL